MDLVKEIASHEGSVNATVLVMMLDEMKRSGITDPGLIRCMVSKSRATDCLPSVKASYMMLEKGDLDGAEDVIGMSESSQEHVLRAVALARIRMARGDPDGARDAARTAHGYDPSNRDAYEILIRTDRGGGWGQRENIQDVLEGARPTNPPGEGRMQELYSIYYDWFSGRRQAASQKLVDSQWYKAGDMEFRLASARMSADERDWRSALMVYSDLVRDAAPSFVMVEAAGASLGAGDPRMALDMLARSGSRTGRAREVAIRAYLLIGDRNGMVESLRSLLDDENSGSDEYLRAVRFLLDRGMDEEASAILERYSKYIGDDSVTLTMRSAVLMRGGDYPAAYYAASRAVRKDGNDLTAKAQLARMLYLKNEPEKAGRLCEEILATDPGNTDALELMAARHMAAREYDKAAEDCRRILERDPSDADALTALAETMAWTGDAAKAEETFRKVVRIDGSRDRAVGVVSAMIGCGMNREAESLASSLEKLYARDPVLRRLKGNAQYALGEYMKASISYSEAAAMDPENAVLWHSKGMADEVRGDGASALEAYERAVRLDPLDAEYWDSLASVQEKNGDRKAAVTSLNRAIALDPGSAYPLIRKASILSAASRHSEAAYYLGHARAMHPDDVRVMDMQADELMASGDPAGAVKVLEERVSKEPSEAASLRLSRYLLSSGDRDGAMKALDEASRAFPDSKALAAEKGRIGAGAIGPKQEAVPAPPEPEPEKEEEPEAAVDPAAHRSMAEALLDAGDLKGAMREIDTALSVAPDDQDLYCVKAMIVLRKGDPEGASFLASSALAGNTRHAGLHRVNALARETKGDLRGALNEIDEAIAYGLDDGRSNAIKGRILESSGERERAVASYTKAVALDPDDANTSDALARLQIAMGDARGASSTVARNLRRHPGRVDSILLMAEAGRLAEDPDAVREAATALAGCHDVSDAAKERMKEIADSMGIHEPPAEGARSQAGRWDASVKRYAEKVLRRAYTTHIPADDPDIMDAMGLDPDIAAKVSAYMADRPDIGEVGPAMVGFDTLERKSHDIVLKLGWTDLEGHPDIPLEKVFVAGGFKDADSAKEMREYMLKAMEAPKREDAKLSDIASGLIKGTTAFDIVKSCGLGVYEADAVRRLIIRCGNRTDVGSPASRTS